ncbi:MAG: DegT/DnrJ/EryC1/StrS family aminotransferase [Bacteroidetes bacterium]|nr:DegT/DnrJ/EryC1/StrS family aminotransferase [Bacteroidota bacterium]
MKIPIARTEFSKAELDNVLKPLQSGWVVQGPFVKEFEKKWNDFTNSKYSIATTSCTTALHLALAALGIGPGDEVVVPSFTWVATANVVEMLGAKPVFCDISLDTFNIEPNLLRNAITGRTKAVIPVHLFGLSADMDAILEITKKHSLYVVEDAACGFGARYKGKHVGVFGDAGCFSFHPRKAITTGEGGMVTTLDDSLADKMTAMRDHGATLSDYQRHHGAKPYLLPDFPYLGFNYRMTDIQGAIGSTQMDRAGKIHESRVAVARKYDAFINTISWLRRPAVPTGYEHGYQSYVCMFKPEEASIKNLDRINTERNKFMDYLQENGVTTRPGTLAVHTVSYYAGKYKISPTQYPNSLIADRCSIALPLFPGLTEGEFEHITSLIRRFVSA